MTPPKFLSIEFHTRFFPALLRGRLLPGTREGTGFSSTFELYVLFGICVVLAVIGLPGAISRNSVIGWATGGIGAAGTVALIINSIISCNTPPSFDRFLTAVFFFFVMLGISAGIFAGSLQHSLARGLVAGSGGLIAGYLLGILAGLWLQRLGWLASLVNGLAGLAVLGMFVVDLVLLF